MGVGAERTTGEVDPASDFDLPYEQFRLQVYRSVRGIVLEAAAAEDLTQETFERAYKARHDFRARASPGAWLHRIAVHTDGLRGPDAARVQALEQALSALTKIVGEGAAGLRQQRRNRLRPGRIVVLRPVHEAFPTSRACEIVQSWRPSFS